MTSLVAPDSKYYPSLHHRYPITYETDNAYVMCNKQIGQTELLLEIHKRARWAELEPPAPSFIRRLPPCSGPLSNCG